MLLIFSDFPKETRGQGTDIQEPRGERVNKSGKISAIFVILLFHSNDALTSLSQLHGMITVRCFGNKSRHSSHSLLWNSGKCVARDLHSSC